MRKYLTDLGAWDDAKEEALLEDTANKVDIAVQKYLNTPKQAVESMFEYMYEQLPESLEEQQADAIRYADTNGSEHG